VAADPQGDGDRDRFRNEGEGHLLDLGDRLEQRDAEPDHQRGDQDGRGKLSGHDERLQADVQDGVGVH
jgi:hypothetical protein